MINLTCSFNSFSKEGDTNSWNCKRNVFKQEGKWSVTRGLKEEMGVLPSQPPRNHGPNLKEGGETVRCLEQVCHDPTVSGEICYHSQSEERSDITPQTVERSVKPLSVLASSGNLTFVVSPQKKRKTLSTFFSFIS